MVATLFAVVALLGGLAYYAWLRWHDRSDFNEDEWMEPAELMRKRFESRAPPSSEPVSGIRSRVTLAKADDEYDVMVMGAGAYGLMQVYHLQLHCPGLKIAIVDPLPQDRMDIVEKSHKIGESTVFTSATFLCRDLGLHDYLIENHCPKHGLFYLWPKKANKTEKWEDYYANASLRLPEIPSFQIDRPKFEQDLVRMIVDKGATYIQGKVKQLELNESEEVEACEVSGAKVARWHTLNVLPVEVKDEESKSSVPLKARHVIDAAGRAFLIPRKKNLLEKNPKQLFDIDNASVWVQVKGHDTSLLAGEAARGETMCSWLYATNHFCGEGYWLWVIPIETRGEKGISIGVSFHKQVHKLSSFNTVDKFMAFLEANQKILYNVCKSGEIVLFRALPSLAHVSKQLYSEHRWYVTGESAYNVDPWFSTGLAWCSYQIQHVTALIQADLYGTVKEATELTQAYNTLDLNTVRSFMLNINRHHKHLGNASIMSWRLLMEVTGPGIPAYFGKYYMCKGFANSSPKRTDNHIWMYMGIYDLFDEIIERKKNVGLMDYNEPGRIFFLWPGFKTSDVPHDLLETDHMSREGKLRYKRVNLHACAAAAQWYLLGELVTLVWRGFGPVGFLRPAVYERIGYLLKNVALAVRDSFKYKWNARHLVKNERFHKRRIEFQSYEPEGFIPWNVKEKEAEKMEKAAESME